MSDVERDPAASLGSGSDEILGFELSYQISRLHFLPDEFERQFQERFPPSPYLGAVVYILKNTAASVEEAVRARLLECCSQSRAGCPPGPRKA